ncbi:MAG: DUF4440 domain-containing protein [Anaerolineales bacterium]|nr:DUF4440 domain-containing protein [Anaerolineales bacterium]
MSHKVDNDNNRSDLSEITKAICAADKSLIAAEVSRDLEAAMKFMAPNVILHPPDMPMVVGREAVREFYVDWFALPYISIQVHSQRVTVANSGDLAYLVGESSFVLRGPQGELEVPGKYLDVWEKVGCEWKLAAISWNGNTALDTI